MTQDNHLKYEIILCQFIHIKYNQNYQILVKNNNQNIIEKQTLEIIRVILKQNYFHYNDKYFKTTKDIAMGSPISIALEEIYLPCFEKLIVKHRKEPGEITYYRRYVDDIIIISDQNKINEYSFTNYMNSKHKYLEFKLTEEENQNISYIDLSIHRNNNIQLGIYRKPTQTDTSIHFTPDHPLEHKVAACNFYINRMLSTSLIEQARKQEWETICTIYRNNGFPLQNIHNLKNKIIKTHKKKLLHKHKERKGSHLRTTGHSYTKSTTSSKVTIKHFENATP